MSEFILTQDNYYSQEANERYMSFHQYLSFVGGMLITGCEAKAMAELKGEWQDEKTTALMVGSYVDSYFEGTLDKFKEENPDLFTKQGELKAPYKQAEKMIARCEQDDYFMATMSGDKQVIMTANWCGCDWKIKMDSYIPGVAIVDLKTSADIHKSWRIADYGYASFIEAFNYHKQLALYQKIVEINTGKKLPCYISVVTKSDNPEICVINIDQQAMDNALNEIQMNMPQVLAVKRGDLEPIRCNHCNYCIATHKIKGPIRMYDLINE